MKKPPIGFTDLISPEIRKELEAKDSDPTDTWKDAEEALIQGLSLDQAITNAKAGSEAAFVYLLGLFGKYVAEDAPSDPRMLRTDKALRDRLSLEYYLLEILDSPTVRGALYPVSGKEADKYKTIEKHVDYALEVARILGFSDVGKDEARKKVAALHGVSFSTVRDAYEMYGKFARSECRREGATYK